MPVWGKITEGFSDFQNNPLEGHPGQDPESGPPFWNLKGNPGHLKTVREAHVPRFSGFSEFSVRFPGPQNFKEQSPWPGPERGNFQEKLKSSHRRSVPLPPTTRPVLGEHDHPIAGLGVPGERPWNNSPTGSRF
ncbi:hypothetical protein JTB14_024127 [Gonioctena quinquepunctata]|nr:hypothetical protein JTB14_024127 [Gonioctena quinquepunctata]